MTAPDTPQRVVDDVRFPRDFHQTRMRRRLDRSFTDPDELADHWGGQWGAVDEVGKLRRVLVRQPGQEFGHVDLTTYDPTMHAFVDPRGRWYWTGEEPPNIDRILHQHANLVAVLRETGVDVTVAPPTPFDDIKAMYVRDPLICAPGGVIVCRLAPEARAGEEADLTRLVAQLGVPVLGTVVGKGTMEGGSAVKIRDGLLAVGRSIRVNHEGIEQVQHFMAASGWQVLDVPISGFSIHLDLHLVMVDHDLALVEPSGVPYDFLQTLGSHGIEVIWADPDEPWSVNCLALGPRQLLMSQDAPRTARRLRARGVEVIDIPYDEIHRNGGGIHCSTVELHREPRT